MNKRHCFAGIENLITKDFHCFHIIFNLKQKYFSDNFCTIHLIPVSTNFPPYFSHARATTQTIKAITEHLQILDVCFKTEHSS